MNKKRFEEIKKRYPYETSAHSNPGEVGRDIQWLIETIEKLYARADANEKLADVMADILRVHIIDIVADNIRQGGTLEGLLEK